MLTAPLLLARPLIAISGFSLPIWHIGEDLLRSWLGAEAIESVLGRDNEH